eukprot:TRINITY_DN657_c0_g1_i1.p1 TRINITY_DN657_c0_g1~~TRINITY_DN657_c0_g1_i1.p1  ORF type:complete len:356 (-),score=36.14 TRINITY_DN657_c0_g1_i1:85-1044(-)
MTIKDYNDRAFMFPVICNESLLYLYHFLNNAMDQIVTDFEKFNELNEDWEPGCAADPTYNVIINFSFLILVDLAALSSVSTLIATPGALPYQMFINAVPFVALVILDIVSESIILVYHDIPICDQEEEIIHENDTIFLIAKILQVIVFLGWLGALVYMIIAALNVHCTDTCKCNILIPGLNCSSPFCPNGVQCNSTYPSEYCFYQQKGTCQPTMNFPPGMNMNFTSNCTLTQIKEDCILQRPNYIGCVLLGLVLIESLYQLIGMYFKSYIYPITIPESVMFIIYWMNDDKDKIVLKVGKNEFGLNWERDQMETYLLYDS